MSELITDNVLDNQLTIGDSSVFAIRYAFIGKDRMTKGSLFADVYEQRWGIKVDDESTWVRKD